MKTIKIVSFALLIFTTSCMDSYHTSYSYHTIVKGRVINYESKEPIEGVLVTLQDGIGSGGNWYDLGGGNTSSGKQSSTYTDKDGNFNIELEGEHMAIIRFKKDGYPNGVVGDLKSYPDGVFNNELFEMEAEAWFCPFLKSETPTYVSDTVYFEILSKYLSHDDILNGKKYSTTGFYRFFYGAGPFCYGLWDNDNGYLSTGDTYQPYRITLTRQGVKTVTIDSVFVKSFTTFNDTIYY